MDYAQIARNIASGHGFATSILRPLAVSGIVGLHDGTTPDISRAPLYPFVLMVAFILHGGHGGGNVVILVSLLFFLASAYAVYRLAQAVLPSEQPWPALLSAGMYIIGGNALGYAVSGLPVSLATLLVSLFLLSLHRAHETGGKPKAGLETLLVGLLLGLCYLVQYSLLLLAIPTLIYIYASRAPARALQGVLLCAAGFLVVTLPWLIRNAVVTHGNPFFSLLLYGVMADTSEYPGATTIYRSVLPEATPFLVLFCPSARDGRQDGARPDVLPGALDGRLFDLGLRAGGCVAACGVSPTRASMPCAAYAAVCLVLIALVTAVISPSAQILAPFAPIMIVLAVGFVWEIMAQQRWPALSQRLTLWGWGAMVGLGLFRRADRARPCLSEPGAGRLDDARKPAAAAAHQSNGPRRNAERRYHHGYALGGGLARAIAGSLAAATTTNRMKPS